MSEPFSNAVPWRVVQVFSKLQQGRVPALPEIIKGIADIQGITRS